MLSRSGDLTWDLLVNDYIEQTKTADIWMEPPAMYAESEEYSRSHPWGELNPQVPHQIPDGPIEVSPIEELVPESRTYAGRMIGTAGVIRRRPTKWLAMPNLPEWVIQVQTAKPGHEYETVYCRVTTAADVGFKEGDIVAVYGLVLGAGHVKQADGRGILDVAYMACSAVEKIPAPKSSAGDQAKG